MVNVAQHIPNVKFNTWETENYYAVDSWISFSEPIHTSDAKSDNDIITLENCKNSVCAYLPSSIYLTEGTTAARCLTPELITNNTSLSPTAIHFKTTNSTNQQWQ